MDENRMNDWMSALVVIRLPRSSVLPNHNSLGDGLSPTPAEHRRISVKPEKIGLGSIREI